MYVDLPRSLSLPSLPFFSLVDLQIRIILPFAIRAMILVFFLLLNHCSNDYSRCRDGEWMPRYYVSISKSRPIGRVILERWDCTCVSSGPAYIFSFAHAMNLIKTAIDFQAVQKRNLANSIGSAIKCCTRTCYGKERCKIEDRFPSPGNDDAFMRLADYLSPLVLSYFI